MGIADLIINIILNGINFFYCFFVEVFKLIVWIISLDYKGANISFVGEVLSKIIVPILTTFLVTSLNIKNRGANKILMTLFGIIIGFILSYIIMIFELYGILITAGILTSICILLFARKLIIQNK